MSYPVKLFSDKDHASGSCGKFFMMHSVIMILILKYTLIFQTTLFLKKEDWEKSCMHLTSKM